MRDNEEQFAYSLQLCRISIKQVKKFNETFHFRKLEQISRIHYSGRKHVQDNPD